MLWVDGNSWQIIRSAGVELVFMGTRDEYLSPSFNTLFNTLLLPRTDNFKPNTALNSSNNSLYIFNTSLPTRAGMGSLPLNRFSSFSDTHQRRSTRLISTTIYTIYGHQLAQPGIISAERSAICSHLFHFSVWFSRSWVNVAQRNVQRHTPAQTLVNCVLYFWTVIYWHQFTAKLSGYRNTVIFI